MDDYVYRYVYEHGTKMERNLMTLWRVSKESGDNSDKFKDLEIFRQEMAEKYGLIPYEMEANMSVPDIKKGDDINNSNNSGIMSQTSNSSNISNVIKPKNSNNTITKNCNNNITKNYDNKTVNNVIYNIPEKDNNIGSYRDVLPAIFAQTRNDIQLFKGFVNGIKNNDIVLYNVFWNKNVFTCSHVHVFNNRYGDIINVGDFIEFTGEINKYTRGNGSKDVGIDIMKIRNIVHPDLSNIKFTSEYRSINITIRYLDKLSKEDLLWFYQVQLDTIKESLKYCKLYPFEMYLSIFLSVYYEDTKEYEMYKEKLDIVTEDNVEPEICKWICFIRFLVCDNNILSPFVVYTLFTSTLKRGENRALNKYYGITTRRYALNNLKNMLKDVDKQDMRNKFDLSLLGYIHEFKIDGLGDVY